MSRLESPSDRSLRRRAFDPSRRQTDSSIWLLAPLLALLIGSSAPAIANDKPLEDPLPAGVRFRLNGEEIGEEEFCQFVGAEFRGEKEAPSLIESMLRERVIELEGERRRLDVTDRDVDERFRQVEQQTVQESRGAKSLAAVLAESKVSEQEFRLVLRRSLLLEKIVRDDLRQRDREVSQAKVNLWLQDRMRRAITVTIGLPNDLVARVDGEPVRVVDFGRRYLAQFPPDHPRTRELENEFLRAELARREFERHGFSLSQEDLDRALAERERALRAKPGFADLTLDDFLQKTGSSVAILRAKPSFRTQLRLLRMVDEIAFPGPELYWFYRSRKSDFDLLYGPTVLLSTLFLRTGTEGAIQAGLATRRAKDASLELEAVRNRLLDGRLTFSGIAQSKSDDPSAKVGGDLGWVGANDATYGPLVKRALEAPEETRYLGPIEVTDGVHLIEIRGRRPKPNYEQLIPQVRNHASLEFLDGLARRASVVRGRTTQG